MVYHLDPADEQKTVLLGQVLPQAMAAFGNVERLMASAAATQAAAPTH